ncbi:MAG: outer rane biosis protein [Verrucomicrobiales bacterium]|nr:outer rane biosis protein [Verrucomicrobiales bacterium]
MDKHGWGRAAMRMTNLIRTISYVGSSVSVRTRYLLHRSRMLVRGYNRLLLLLLSFVAVCLHAAEWPEWRGPTQQGHAIISGAPQTWSAETNITWKTTVPGRGWSSPVIEGKEIWMTTAIEAPAKPEDIARRLKVNTGDQPLTLVEGIELRAVCVDLVSGKLLQNVLLLSEREPQWVHELNSYASPSPVIEDGRLYCHFGTFGTACVDTKAGRVVWTNDTLHVFHDNGPGSSPVLWKGLLIFHLDGTDQQYLVALDKKTGKVVWKTNRSGQMDPAGPLKKSYTTPILLKVNGTEELISPAASWLYSYDPATGRELWKVSYGVLGFSISPRTVVGHGMIYLSTCFPRAEMLAVRYEGLPQPQIAWRYGKGVPNMSSPLLVGEELYFVNDGGILTCLDAKTGNEHYRERLGGNFSSSPTLADGRIYFSNQEGATYVVKPGKSFEVLAKNELPGKIFASLAVADRAFFLRTDTSLYRIEQK